MKPRLVDVLPAPSVVALSPKLILKRSKYIVSDPNSIALQVRARKQEKIETIPEQSIAKQVARRRREAASPVLDQETGELLKNHKLRANP